MSAIVYVLLSRLEACLPPPPPPPPPARKECAGWKYSGYYRHSCAYLRMQLRDGLHTHTHTHTHMHMHTHTSLMCNAIPKRCVVLNPCIAILDKALRLIYDGKYIIFFMFTIIHLRYVHYLSMMSEMLW